MIERKAYLDALRRWRDKQVIKVITGIRRCGKSTLMELFREELRREGIPDSRIIAVNLEDYSNTALRDPMKLRSFILDRARGEGKNVCVPGWHPHCFLSSSHSMLKI